MGAWAPLTVRCSHGVEGFGDLNGVEGGALAELVAGDEQINAAAVGLADVLANPADEDIVTVAGVDGHGEIATLAVVDDPYAGGGREDLANPALGDGLGEGQIDALGVSPHHGHPDAGCRDPYLIVVQHLTRFLDHLHLFLVVAVVADGAVVGEEIEGDLVGQDLGLGGLAAEHVAGLLFQLDHGPITGAAGGLVGAGHDAFDAVFAIKGGDRHDHDDGRTIGVGDDPFVRNRGIGIDLRYDQRHFTIHPKCRTVIDDDASASRGFRRQLPGKTRTGAEDREVEACKDLRPRLLDRDFLFAHQDLPTGRTRGSEQPQFGNRELPIQEQPDQLLTHRSGGADDANLVTHGMMEEEYERLIQRCKAWAIKPTNQALIVSIGRQEMTFWADGGKASVFAVSTGRNPPSCATDSLGTPTGLHVIADKVGDGEPLGTVFRYRLSLGRRYWEMEPEEQKKNLITTRFMRLRGLEEGHNAGQGRDSYDRLIYIHGTNHENKIGRPNSAGCIEMRNPEVLDLFDRIAEGSLVLIEE